MKKILIILVMLAVMVSFSCKRSEITGPDYKHKFTETYMITLKTNPTTMMVFSTQRDVVDVTIKLTDSKGAPVAYGDIFLSVSDNQFNQEFFGYFEGGLNPTIIKRTNSSGEIKIRYFGPIHGEYIRSTFHITGMYISTDHNPITSIFKSSPILLIWGD